MRVRREKTKGREEREERGEEMKEYLKNRQFLFASGHSQ